MSETLTTCIDGIDITATLYPAKNKTKLHTFLCLPGGGVTAELFNLSEGHSFTALMNTHGYDIITMDHPGTATNPLPDTHPFLHPHKAAEYLTRASEVFLDGRPAIGLGHSMGGMVVTLMQSQSRQFSGVSLLGSSAGGLDWGLSEEEKTYIERQDDFLNDIEKLTLAKFGADFIKYPNSGPSGNSITFGGETPALTQRLRDITTTLYAAGGLMSMMRGSFRREVNSLDVPLFIAFGDHDIGIPPEDVPQDYMNAPSTELHVLSDTGHNHVAFTSITTLCDALDRWVQRIPS